jgi:uncharacterized protein
MYGLTKSELKLILDYLQDIQGLTKVVIFGSRGRGDHQEYSDIDLCLFAGVDIKATSIREDLNQLQIPYLFDVVQWEELKNEKLKSRIERDGKVLWERER